MVNLHLYFLDELARTDPHVKTWGRVLVALVILSSFFASSLFLKGKKTYMLESAYESFSVSCGRGDPVTGRSPVEMVQKRAQ